MKKTIIITMMCLMAAIGAKAQENITYEAWEGTMKKGNTPVQVFIEKRNDGIVAGWIRYPKAKNPDYIFLAGHTQDDGEEGEYMSLFEYQKDGHQNGCLYLSKAERGYTACWINIDNDIDVVFDSEIDYPDELKNQLVPATRDEIGKKYAFEYDHITGDTRGGTAEFKLKGTEKLAYDISVYAPNLAEGNGVGALFGNIMTGVEEGANYEFHVEFFPRFCVISDIVGPEEGYYGAWTTFANIYIKVNGK